MKKLIIVLLMLIASWCMAGTRVETQDIIISNAHFRVYGTNQSIDSIGYGGNGIEIDGSTNVDKNLLFLDDGKKTYTWMLYRTEAGKFIYLHDYELQKQIMTISRGGRIGINKMNNILDSHNITSRTNESSDLIIDNQKTLYPHNYELIYLLTVDGTNATADTFKIETAPDNKSAYSTVSTGNVMFLTTSNIGNNIWLYWTNVTGHAIGEYRKFIAIPQLPRNTLGVSPSFIDEVIVDTNFYGAHYYIDRAYEANSSEYGSFRPLRTGTNSVTYIGMTCPNNAFYINIITSGVGVVTKWEYWSGGSWKSVTNLVDNTSNFIASGSVYYDTELMSDWAKTNLTLYNYTNEYYWLRIYSTNNITIEPWVECITRHGENRFAVYAAPLDSLPVFKIDAQGRMWLDGYAMDTNLISTFYLKFQAQCSTQITAVTTNVIMNFTTKVSDAYNIYTNQPAWYPITTNLVRINFSVRASGAVNAGRGFYVVLFENGIAIRDIGLKISGDNADIPMVNSTYIFKPSSLTNWYQIGCRSFTANNVTLAGNNTNWWFGEKIQ